MELLAIISLVASILNIILFFKIWGMTNNVKTIRRSISSGSDLSCLVTGDKEETKRLLASMFASEAKTIVALTMDGSIESEEAKKRINGISLVYKKKAESLGVDINFGEIGTDVFRRIKTVLKNS